MADGKASGAPNLPAESATATGHTMLYCISSVVSGRRVESQSAAAKVWISTAAI